MSSEAGPSRPMGPASAAGHPIDAASTSSSVATSSTTTPATTASVTARPGAFAATGAARGTAVPTGPVSAVARGKQPVQTTAAQGGSRPGGVQQQAGTSRPTTGGQQGATPVNSATGPVSVGGPAGLVRRQVLNSILVNTRQKGNPVIGHIRQVPWEYGDIKCDYQVGATSGVLYLSIRYHLLHPEYIHQRISDLGGSYNLRIMLVQCDADNHTAAMKELTKIALINGYTLMTCWSAQEAGKYLESYKQLERKPPDMIRERVDDSYMAHLTSALTSVRGVNKTDVTTLVSNFGSFSSIVLASPAALGNLPGLGEKKVRRLHEAFSAPFTLQSKNKKRKVVGEAEKRGKSGEQVLN